MNHIPVPNITNYNPQVYYCKKASAEPLLDGDLTKPFWQEAEWTCDFSDIEGDVRPKPRFKTRAKIRWTDTAVYFGAELYGDEIWAHVTKRDDVIFKDNDFEIFIDPDSDTHAYCEFEMNALNTVWDLFITKPYRDGGIPMNSFDIKGLETAVKINGELNNPSAQNTMWSCEIKIPFESILEACGQGAKRPSKGDFWRVNFSRVQWKIDVCENKYIKQTDNSTGKPLDEDNWVWSPTGIVNMHYPELWGYMFFCDGSEKYSIPDDEYIKWELRRLYYAEHAYYDEHGCYSSDLSFESQKIQTKIELTSDMFKISAKSADNNAIISIYTDGEIKRI